MERLNEHYKHTIQALDTFFKALTILKDPRYANVHEHLRDSSIKRFEYSMDTFWKYLKTYLNSVHSIEPKIPSPKGVFRECLTANIISETEFQILANLVEDRNLTSHTYNVNLAEELCRRLNIYYDLMSSVIGKLKP